MKEKHREFLHAVRLFILFYLLSGVARACQIPVYKNALEQWTVAPYELFVFYQGPELPNTGALIARINEAHEADAHLNLELVCIDVAKPITDSGVAALWNEQKNAALPWAVLCYPKAQASGSKSPTPSSVEAQFACTWTRISATQNFPTAWAGKYDPIEFSKLLASPARRKAVELLKGGDAAVWLFLPSGDPARDVPARESLETQLRAQERELILPGSAPNSQIVAGEAPAEGAHPHFSIVTIDRELPFEQGTARILENAFNLPAGRGPLVFPVFGRGRVFGALSGTAILSQSAVANVCKTLCGCCSCQIKIQRPGFDLLLDANWEEDQEVIGDVAPGEATLQPQTFITTPATLAPASAQLQSAQDHKLSTRILVAFVCLLAAGGAIAMRIRVMRRGKHHSFGGESR